MMRVATAIDIQVSICKFQFGVYRKVAYNKNSEWVIVDGF